MTKSHDAGSCADRSVPCATTCPPSAVTTDAQSPCGSAWHSDPTRVPRLRTIGSAISGAAAAIVGCRVASSDERSSVGVPAQRTDADRAVGVDPVVVQTREVVDVDEHARATRSAASAAGPGSGRRRAPWPRRLPRAAGRSPRRANGVLRSGTETDTSEPPLGVGCDSGLGAAECGSGTATGSDSSSGSGRGCWCGGHGPWTGWPATLRKSISSGHAQTVGLLPVLGAFSISSYSRGFPWLWPLDSIGIRAPFRWDGALGRRRR